MDLKLNLVHSLYLACKFFLSDELVQMIEEFSFLGYLYIQEKLERLSMILHKPMALKGLAKIPVRQVKSGSVSC